MRRLRSLVEEQSGWRAQNGASRPLNWYKLVVVPDSGEHNASTPCLTESSTSRVRFHGRDHRPPWALDLPKIGIRPANTPLMPGRGKMSL
jgi:hypothetical protein